MLKKWFVCFTILLFLTALFFPLALCAQHEHQHDLPPAGEKREELKRIQEEYDQEWAEWRNCLFDMRVEPGLVIGEIGAGRGELAVLMARRVGPGGHVYANEIDPNRVKDIQQLSAKEEIKNLTAILGTADDPLFPEGIVDLVVMIEVLHHIQNPLPILEATRERIKPGAAIVVVEPDVNQEGGKKEGCYADPVETRKIFEKAGLLYESMRKRKVVDLEFFVMEFRAPPSRSM